MTKASGWKARRDSIIVASRFTPEEAAQVDLRCAQLGLNRVAYLRMLITSDLNRSLGTTDPDERWMLSDTGTQLHRATKDDRALCSPLIRLSPTRTLEHQDPYLPHGKCGTCRRVLCE